MFTYAIVSEVNPIQYGRRWCYSDKMTCLTAFEEWRNPDLAPMDWHRAVHSGERKDEKGETVGFW